MSRLLNMSPFHFKSFSTQQAEEKPKSCVVTNLSGDPFTLIIRVTRNNAPTNPKTILSGCYAKKGGKRKETNL